MRKHRTRNPEIPRCAIAHLRSGPSDHPGMTITICGHRTSRRSPANLHVAAATFAGATLRGRSEFEVTAARDRAAAALVADDLARGLRPGRAGLRPRPVSRRALGAVGSVTPGGRRFRAALLAVVVVIEDQAFGAD